MESANKVKIHYWVSSPMGTCEVHVKNGRIVWVCKLWGRFLNQPLSSLVSWLEFKHPNQVLVDKL